MKKTIVTAVVVLIALFLVFGVNWGGEDTTVEETVVEEVIE